MSQLCAACRLTAAKVELDHCWPVMSYAVKTFRQAVCETFQCGDDRYEECVFRQCLPSHAIWLAGWIHRLDPDYFADDFLMIRAVALETEPRQLKVEVENHRYAHPVRGLLRGWLGIRVSGQELVKLGYRLLGSGEKMGPAP